MAAETKNIYTNGLQTKCMQHKGNERWLVVRRESQDIVYFYFYLKKSYYIL